MIKSRNLLKCKQYKIIARMKENRKEIEIQSIWSNVQSRSLRRGDQKKMKGERILINRSSTRTFCTIDGNHEISIESL